MRGDEFVDRLKRLARVNDQTFRFDAKRGKGSHGTVWIGNRFAVVPNLRSELKKGTMSGICRSLGVKPQDLFDL